MIENLEIHTRRVNEFAKLACPQTAFCSFLARDLMMSVFHEEWRFKYKLTNQIAHLPRWRRRSAQPLSRRKLPFQTERNMAISTPNESRLGVIMPGAGDRDQSGPIFLTWLDCVLHILHLAVEAGMSE